MKSVISEFADHCTDAYNRVTESVELTTKMRIHRVVDFRIDDLDGDIVAMQQLEVMQKQGAWPTT